MHNHGTVSKHRLFGKMRNQQHRDFFFFIQTFYDVQYLFSSARVEHSRRFVQNHNAGFQSQNARNSNSLLLTARKTVGRSVAEFRHTHCVQCKRNAFPDFLTGHPDVFRAESNIVLYDRGNHLIVGVLEYNPDLFANIKKVLGLGSVQP